jgi:hypothetical protein
LGSYGCGETPGEKLLGGSLFAEVTVYTWRSFTVFVDKEIGEVLGVIAWE